MALSSIPIPRKPSRLAGRGVDDGPSWKVSRHDRGEATIGEDGRGGERKRTACRWTVFSIPLPARRTLWLHTSPLDAAHQTFEMLVKVPNAFARSHDGADRAITDTARLRTIGYETYMESEKTTVAPVPARP
jgi:hypothetical protein